MEHWPSLPADSLRADGGTEAMVREGTNGQDHPTGVAQHDPEHNGDNTVLVAEDHAPTARIITTVLDDVAPSVTTQAVGDGETCLSILRGQSDSRVTPDLLLLDLDLPVVDGLTVLETRMNDPSLSHIPAVVVSGEDNSETIEECYRKGANAFIAKPGDLDEFTAAMKTITSFWFSMAELPMTCHSADQ